MGVGRLVWVWGGVCGCSQVGVGVARWMWVWGGEYGWGGTSKNETLIGFVHLKIDVCIPIGPLIVCVHVLKSE